MQETYIEDKRTQRKQILIVAKSFLLFGLLFLPLTGLTQLLYILVGGLLVLYLFVKLLAWFLRWAWAQVRNQPFSYQHQWLGLVSSWAVYAIIVSVHFYAMNQADQLALKIGTRIQASCDSGNRCSIPNEFLTVGSQTTPATSIQISATFLGQDYPVRVRLVDENRQFQILVFHTFQISYQVNGGVEKKYLLVTSLNRLKLFVFLFDLFVAEAGCFVIVDHPHRLHECVQDG